MKEPGLFDHEENPDLPIPPLRLRRIVLQGIGPPGARFDPLDLDFTAAGAAASRVLLSLTNTGGKSTLITLVSSVIVPAVQKQVGGKNLGDYLLTGDTGHVVCEWEDSSTRTRTVTGVVMEWKDGKRQPSERQRTLSAMNRTWYLFQTGPGRPGLDELPLLTGERRSSREQFLAALNEMFTQYPEMRGLSATKQNVWASALDDNTSIDPVLFSYQMRMNDSESGAEALLATFDTPENVVRFFVGALNDEQATSDFTSNLAEYSKIAASRPELEALYEFCTEAGPAVADVARRADNDSKARTAEKRAAVEGAELAAALRTRIAGDTTMLAELRDAAAQAAARNAQLRREAGTIPDVRLQLRLEQARAVRSACELALLNAKTVASNANDEADAWAAVNDHLEAVVARSDLYAAQAAFNRADESLEPLRQAVETAGSQLAARLDTLIVEADAAGKGAAADRVRADTAFDDALADKKSALDRQGDAERTITSGRNAMSAASDATDGAVRLRLLRDGEAPAAALDRWDTKRDTAREEAKAEKAQAAAADKAYDADESVQRDAQAARSAADKALTVAQSRASAFTAELAEAATHPALAALLDGSALSPTDISRAGTAASHAASDADQRANSHETLAAAAERDLAHLQEHGTAPPGADVLAVQKALEGELIGAVTGLKWADRNITDAEVRSAFIRDNPEIAGGVVVTDPARFSDAVAVLDAADLTLRTPVTATIAPNTPGVGGLAGDVSRHVVLPHRATWDRAWAERMRTELEGTVTTEGNAGREAREAAKAHRAGLAAAEAFTARWKGIEADQLADAVTRAEARLTETDDALTAVTERRQANRDAAATHRKRAENAQTREREAAGAIGPLGKLIDLTEAAERAREQRPRLEQDRTDAIARATAADDAQRTARNAISDATTRAETLRIQKRDLSAERDALAFTPAAQDPGGNLGTVRSQLTTAERILGDAAAGMEESRHLEGAKQHHAAAVARRNHHQSRALARAAVLAGTIDAADPDVLHTSARRARDAATTAQRQLIQAEADMAAAEHRVKENSPGDPQRPNHADLTSTPEWKPTTPDDINGLLAKLDMHAQTMREQTNAAAKDEEEANELFDAVNEDIEHMGDSVSLWAVKGVETTAMPPFEGAKELARTEMRRLLGEHQEAAEHATGAAATLAEALGRARRIANDPRWTSVPGHLPTRIRGFTDHEFTAEATELNDRIAAVAESARGDLDNLDTHRSLLRDGLIQLCSDQRSLLRDVSSSSRLPDGLGGLFGQLAIKISFEPAAEDEAAGRLADRIDQWAQDIAANAKRSISTETRIRWLADAVGATVIDRPRAGRFSIEVLKPTLDGHPQYCAPNRIPIEFSGGQVLTLAVLVYCSLSKVRSSRRASGPRPAGTLLLDNPFGAASAPPLIAMQHRLAARSGVQLICATGIHDPGVDAAFSGKGSVVVKLRNDGDVRRNLSFLRLRSALVEGTDIAGSLAGGRDRASPRNWVDATSYEVQR